MLHYIRLWIFIFLYGRKGLSQYRAKQQGWKYQLVDGYVKFCSPDGTHTCNIQEFHEYCEKHPFTSFRWNGVKNYDLCQK